MGDLVLHEPVMKEEVASFIRGENMLIDATVGTGGHAEFLLQRFAALRILGLDKDRSALKVAEQRLKRFASRVKLLYSDYRRLPEMEIDWSQVEGVFFDLGISSFQLAAQGRGFSYLRDEVLDMRFDPSVGEPAYVWLNKASYSELVQAFLDYADLKRAYKLARSILELRPNIKTTYDVITAVRKAYGQAIPSLLSRVFQAIRIAVNRELEGLDKLLEKLAEKLNPGSRLLLVTFHSYEDRIVKQTFRRMEKEGKARVLTKKPVLPSEAEVSVNPRARSAHLRVCEVI